MSKKAETCVETSSGSKDSSSYKSWLLGVGWALNDGGWGWGYIRKLEEKLQNI